MTDSSTEGPSKSQKVIIALVYMSLLLDNVLLTVVVPIIPVYLYTVENPTAYLQNSTLSESFSGEENGRVGFLLSSKAIVQLLVNPIIGSTARFTGYSIPLFFGLINLLVSSLLFAYGESYVSLFFARSLQGVASACIGVAGMSIVAECCPSEKSRSKLMGVVLGSVALGVLLGYPFGGLLFDFVGKRAPFLTIATLTTINIGLQLAFLNLKPAEEKAPMKGGFVNVMSDALVLLTSGAIWLSTSAIAILEPCLPIWLMTTIKPQKWQLGMVFIPDSLGYLIGTNFFGTFAYKVGQWRTAIGAMVVVGIAAIVVPSAKHMGELVVPHFFLGLGIGVIDAALVPLLATLVDTRHGAHYATVYALQQMAVSLAYSIGPLIGGSVIHSIGFPWLMRTVGLINLLYSPALVLLSKVNVKQSNLLAASNSADYKATENESNLKYKRFYESDESD